MPCAAPGSAPSAFDTESLKVVLWLWFVPETRVIGLLYGVGDGSLVARPRLDIGRVPPVCGSSRDGLTANLHDRGHFAVNRRLTFGVSGGFRSLNRERGVNRSSSKNAGGRLRIGKAVHILAGDLLTSSPSSPPQGGEGRRPNAPCPPKAARLLEFQRNARQATLAAPLR